MAIDSFDQRVKLDSRLVSPGDYFVPIKGENFDGHDFIDLALKNGAAGVLEEEELYRLASQKLKAINPKVIAITGSLGKSTTREFVSTLLSTKYRVTQGSLNTKLGLATNIINDLTKTSEYFIAECGMDRPGELKETGEFINPDIVVLTNISESHYQFFNSLENIIKGKGDLLSTVRKNGRIYINWESKNARKALVYSNTKDIVKYSKKDIDSLGENLPIIGEHNLLNLACAYKIALDEGVSKTSLDKSIVNIKLPKGRMQVLAGINDSVIIDDSYNASAPDALISSLNTANEYFAKNKMKRFITVLGGMAELGEFSQKAHDKVAKVLNKLKPDFVILSGELSKIYTAKLDRTISHSVFMEHPEVVEFVKTKVKPTTGDLLFFKGSQSTRLEKIIEPLLKDPSKARVLLPRQDARWK